MRHLFLCKSAKEESDTLEKSNSVTSDVTWRMNARRACPASRASPTEKSRRACALGATMKGTAQPKTRLPPTRSFVHGYCRCCCCHARCRRYRNREWTPPSVATKDRFVLETTPRSPQWDDAFTKSPRVTLKTSNSRGAPYSRISSACIPRYFDVCYIVRISSSLFRSRFWLICSFFSLPYIISKLNFNYSELLSLLGFLLASLYFSLRRAHNFNFS